MSRTHTRIRYGVLMRSCVWSRYRTVRYSTVRYCTVRYRYRYGTKKIELHGKRPSWSMEDYGYCQSGSLRVANSRSYKGGHAPMDLAGQGKMEPDREFLLPSTDQHGHNLRMLERSSKCIHRGCLALSNYVFRKHSKGCLTIGSNLATVLHSKGINV